MPKLIPLDFVGGIFFRLVFFSFFSRLSDRAGFLKIKNL